MLRLNSPCDGTGNQFDHDRESIRGKQGINCDNRESIPFAAMKHLFRTVSLTIAGRSRAPLPPIITAPTRREAGGRRATPSDVGVSLIRRMPPFCKPPRMM